MGDSLTVENILSDLIRIQTVNPPGGETAVAKYLKNLFDQYKIPNEIIEPAPGRGNFLAYLGKGEKSLLYLSHTDVVPVTEGWSFAPFSGEIKNGFVHGRGALDCKGLVAAEAYAMIELARNTNLKGRLIYAATACEEMGGVWGVKYLVDNCKDKVTADFVINEGAEPPAIIGGKTCHFIGVGEKGYIWVDLKARGTSRHASLPMLGDNAVVKMAGVVKSLADYQPRIVLIPAVKKLIEAVAGLEGIDGAVTEKNVDRTIRRLKDREFSGYLAAITRMTVSPDVIRGGAKRNVVPDNCELEVDVRVLPGQDKDYVSHELAPLIANVEMQITRYDLPTVSSSESEYYRLAADTLKELVGGAPVLPSVSSGGTDSKHLRPEGLPCYGIGMMTLNLDNTMRQSVHGRDEKIDVDSLRLKTDFLVKLARTYLGD